MLRFVVFITTALTFASAAAHAQERVASEARVWSDLFNTEDLDALCDCTGAPPELRSRGRATMLDAMRRATAATGRFGKKRWNATWRNIEAANGARHDWTELAESVDAIERDAMDALRGLLTDAKAETGWGCFERARRRLLLPFVEEILAFGTPYNFDTDDESDDPQNLSAAAIVYDLRLALKDLDIPDADRRAAADALEQHEVALDALIRQWRSVCGARLRARHLHLDRPEQSYEDRRRAFEAARAIGQQHVRGCRAVAAALSNTIRHAFIRSRLRRELADASPESRKFVKFSYPLDYLRLSEDQQRAAKELFARADAELSRIDAGALDEYDRFVLGNEPVEESRYAPDIETLSERMTRTKEIFDRVEREFLDLLTDEQRRIIESREMPDDEANRVFDLPRQRNAAKGLFD